MRRILRAADMPVSTAANGPPSQGAMPIAIAAASSAFSPGVLSGSKSVCSLSLVVSFRMESYF
jgi:hypothetical protein